MAGTHHIASAPYRAAESEARVAARAEAGFAVSELGMQVPMHLSVHSSVRSTIQQPSTIPWVGSKPGVGSECCTGSKCCVTPSLNAARALKRRYVHRVVIATIFHRRGSTAFEH